MARSSVRCRCGSRKKAHRCCAPIHAGRPAPSPEALMRSRYAAYALGLVDHIIATTDPSGPQWEADTDAWAERIRSFSTATRFVGLSIDASPVPQDGVGYVTFTASLQQHGEDASFTERSRFTAHPARGWRYHSGERLPIPADSRLSPPGAP